MHSAVWSPSSRLESLEGCLGPREHDEKRVTALQRRISVSHPHVPPVRSLGLDSPGPHGGGAAAKRHGHRGGLKGYHDRSS